MKLINQTPYNTHVLRSAALLAWRYAKTKAVPVMTGRWATLRIYIILAGAREPSLKVGDVFIRVQKPTGEEWHKSLRGVSEGVLSPFTVAQAVVEKVFRMTGPTFAKLPARYLRRLPPVVPLRIVTPRPAVKRNVTRERYDRVLELERVWTRKAKYAQTKLKGLRQKRRYYEKKLHQPEAI